LLIPFWVLPQSFKHGLRKAADMDAWLREHQTLYGSQQG
jgi:hypothetical protein